MRADRKRVASAVAAVLFAAGCGQGTRSADGGPGATSTDTGAAISATGAVVTTVTFATSTTEALPTSTTRPLPDAPTVDTQACTHYATGPIPEPPGGFDVASEDDPQLQALATSQGAVMPIVEQLQRYAQDHPDGLFSFGLEWHGTDALAVIAYTSDIDQHCSALAVMIGDDQPWVIRWSPYSQTQLRQLADAITSEYGMVGVDTTRPDHGIAGWSVDNGGVLTVRVNPDQRAIAHELLDRYSPQVAIILGAHRYPNLAASTSTCTITDLDIHRTSRLTVAVDPTVTVVSGKRTRIAVAITNATGETIESNQPLDAYLSDGHRILSISGVYARPAVGEPPLVLQPGESTTVQLDLSTATCDPTDGYQLPAGTYQLEVPLEDGWVSTTVKVA